MWFKGVFQAMLRSNGLQVTGYPADEIDLCVPNPATTAWKWDTQYGSVVGKRVEEEEASTAWRSSVGLLGCASLLAHHSA
ncbi:MAG: hypothetical protein EOP80_18380, partial [Variovorax sp.]